MVETNLTVPPYLAVFVEVGVGAGAITVGAGLAAVVCTGAGLVCEGIAAAVVGAVDEVVTTGWVAAGVEEVGVLVPHAVIRKTTTSRITTGMVSFFTISSFLYLGLMRTSIVK